MIEEKEELEMSENWEDNYWGQVSADTPDIVFNPPTNPVEQYVVDFEKVSTVEDVILILKAMNLHIMAEPTGEGQFKEVFPLLKKA